MGLFDSLKGLLGSKAKDTLDTNHDGKLDTADISGLKDQATNLADTNDDGAVTGQGFDKLKNAADVNKDGAVNLEDVQEIKNKF